MTKRYPCHVDCANCAAKLERAINEMDGVEKASINFMMQRITLTMDDEKAPALIPEIGRVAEKIHPGTKIDF